MGAFSQMISSLILLFLKSCLIGFIIALPVGPVGILCIRRTLSGRYGASLMMGAGAAAADGGDGRGDRGRGDGDAASWEAGRTPERGG